MKRSTIILFFFFYLCSTNAQNRYIDSLNKLISKAKTDTARINLVNKKIYRLGEINLDSALKLAKVNLDDARKIDYKKGEANALLNIATNFSTKGNYDSAKKCLTDAEKISYSLGDSDLIGSVYSGLGMWYGVQSKYDTSAIFYQKTADIYERLGNKTSLGRSYGNLAIGYMMQSNFPQALLYQQKSLKLAEEMNNKSGQAYTLMNMGSTYQKMGDTLRAEQSFLKGIGIAKSLGIKNVELYGYSNLAALYTTLNKWDKSYTYAMNAAMLAKTMGDAGIQAASIAKAATALGKSKRYKEAETLAIQAMAIADSAGQPLVLYQTYSTMGSILTEQEKYKDAIPLLEKSIDTLKNADGYDESIADAYASLSLCYEKTGNFEKALKNYKASAEIIDSVRGKENIRKATELNMTSEFEKKKALTDAIQAKKNVEARSRQMLLLGGLLLAVILATGGWIAFRNKQRANRKLEIQKAEIQSTLSKLKTTQAQLIQAEKMASLGELTAGIAHEIQNPLNFVKNFSEVSTELVDDMEEELRAGKKETAIIIAGSLKENLEKITYHGTRASSIVKGMLQHSRNSSGLKEPTNINALADEYLRLSFHGLRAKDKSFNATVKTDFDESLSAPAGKINIISQDVGRVLLNLFTNAFYSVAEKKRSSPPPGSGVQYEPIVSISTKKADGQVEIRVKDNGNGIPQSVVDKIFQPFFTTKPTGQGTGLGLSLSYDIIKTHGGEIKVETNEGEGSEFIITLPIK
ncbi:MAG: tetratricopeptide repeat protein [Ginsengibacter sp.]